MTFKKIDSDKGFSQLGIQPSVTFDGLFNLMLQAQRYGIMFIIFDECENEFDHREIHNLSAQEQRRLYTLARDEIARHWHRNEWVALSPAPETVQ